MIAIVNKNILLKVKIGDFYREKDMLLEHEGQYYIISKNFKSGQDLIEALSNGQRRSQPRSFESLVAIITHLTNQRVHPNSQIEIEDSNYRRVLVA